MFQMTLDCFTILLRTPYLLMSLGVVGLLFVTVLPVMAQKDVNWGVLNLSPQQSQRINQVETQWKGMASQILPQINEDKSELMHLLNTPNSDQRRIMELQGRINQNKTRLQNAAMQTFLKKKEYLNPDQQQQLQQMMGPSFH